MFVLFLNVFCIFICSYLCFECSRVVVSSVEYVGRAILRVTSMNVSMSELQRLFRINESVNGKSVFLELSLL